MENNYPQIYMLTMEDLRCIMHECFHLMMEAKEEQNSERLLSVSEVARMAGVCRSTLNRWRKNEYLVPVKRGTKKNYYKLSDLKRIGIIKD